MKNNRELLKDLHIKWAKESQDERATSHWFK